MSDQEHQQDGLQHRTNGNKVTSHRTSVIAEAMKYEAVQGTTTARDVEKTSSPKSTPEVPPPTHYIEPAQASVFSAFGKDATKQEMDGFEGAGRTASNNYTDKSPVNDMTKQCSMIHRMMEMDKTDIDPRDVHKLLPSTMLTSESLDLRPDGILRISQGTTTATTATAAAAMDLHSLLEDQALKFVAEHQHPKSKSVQGDETHSPSPTTTSSAQTNSASTVDCPVASRPELEVTCESPTTETKDSEKTNPVRVPPQPSKTAPVRLHSGVRSMESSSRSNQTKPPLPPPPPPPSSPVTGWPAAPVLGIMHPMNHTLCHVSRTADMVTTHSLLYTTTTTTTTDSAPQVVPSSANLIRNSATANANAPLITEWQTMAATFPLQNEAIHHQHLYQPPPLPPPPPSFMHDDQSHRGLNHSTMVAASAPPSGSDTSHNSSPRKNSSSNEESQGLESDKSAQEKDEDPNGKNFKSLEAALAWCHVQHSQKQVPVVPKDDVRKLVDFQLNSGKPIRAPWYRPQTQKPEEEVEKKPIEKRPMIPRPERPRRTPPTGNTGAPSGSSSGANSSRKKKQGTGFFCPPGSSMTRV
eukprot:g1901.t1